MTGKTPLLATITRTKDRPQMVARVAKGLQSQSFTDFVWVVVNDGGAPAPLEQIVSDYRKSGLAAKLIHNEQNVGMEAAANIGIRQSLSKYVHVHDDDDTIDDDFYETTVSFLEKNNNMGVVTNINKIFEIVDGDKIETKREHPWDTGMPSIARLVCINRFVPISFVYRRDVHDQIGYYNEKLSVCGDWEFNLRFVRHHDIAKLPEFLANYHIREDPENAVLSNSINDRYEHDRADMEIRNALIREELDKGSFGYAGLITIGAELWYLERRMDGAFSLKDRIVDRLKRNLLVRMVMRL